MNNYRTYTVEEATLRLERYCSYRERCHKEVQDKLREMRMIPEAIDQIFAHLLEQNYLNEGRFAEVFARDKFRIKKWGKQRIVRELKMRELSRFSIENALKQIENEEYLAVFHEIAEKRWDALKGEANPQRRKQKFMNYLQYRGWENQLIWEKLRELISS